MTADAMNKYVRDVHSFLYRPPACKVMARQRGSYSGADPADAYGRGKWLPFNAWAAFPLYVPGNGTSHGEEYDTTGGEMTQPSSSGVLWRLTAPENGIYAITFGGVLEANGEPHNAHFRVGKNQRSDADWSSGHASFASHCPGRVHYAKDGTSRYIGSIATTISLKKSDTISAGAVSDKDFVLARRSLPGRSFLEMRWIGRAP
ncbi:hypothetical protein [Streptomyces sp. NPDC048644]|uniref:hypothetical protein n=1 Tax=Streptomyces sp. NPDC048644 TaxID=3365582 RepID=UPI003724615D